VPEWFDAAFKTACATKAVSQASADAVAALKAAVAADRAADRAAKRGAADVDSRADKAFGLWVTADNNLKTAMTAIATAIAIAADVDYAAAQAAVNAVKVSLGYKGW
jgi:hypothetical protein